MFSSNLGKKLDKFHLLKHPFYQVYWNEGKLTREIIKDYAEQYYQHVKAFPRYVQDKGLADWTGMAILALIGFFNIIGTLVMGYLGDKYSKKILLSGLYFLRGITLILFIFLPASNLSAVLFGTSFGLLWLATVPATNGIVAQIFGTKNLTLLFGIVFLNHQFGSFLGAYLGGYFYDQFGSFDYAWYLAIVLSTVARGFSSIGR